MSAFAPSLELGACPLSLQQVCACACITSSILQTVLGIYLGNMTVWAESANCKGLLASRLRTHYSLRLLFCVSGRIQKLRKYLHGRNRCFGTTSGTANPCFPPIRLVLLSKRLLGFLRPNGVGSVWRLLPQKVNRDQQAFRFLCLAVWLVRA